MIENKTKLHKTKILAEQNLYRSVISINKNLEEEAENKEKDYLTFGVKNTVDIPISLVDKLRKNSKYLFATIDKMSHIGRSIDTDLINPITYRCMTGSSSGTAVNILKGINDFGLGTDGGGSVLAPALSTNLYSFIGSGVGLVTGKESLSTDSISFTGGVGVISKSFFILKDVVEDILEKKIKYSEDRIRVLIPKNNSIILPDGIDMRLEIDKVIQCINENNDVKNNNQDNAIKNSIFKVNRAEEKLLDERIRGNKGHKIFDEKITSDECKLYEEKISSDEIKSKFEFIEYSFDNIYERNIAIKEIKNIFDNDIADIILTYEGPIDVYGYDETIQRSFKGKAEKEITSNGGKGMVKAINMCKCTGITIPGEKLASGFVICAKEGIQGLVNAFTLGKVIEESIEKNEIFDRYFIDRKKFVEPIEL
ncbi:MAG: amidase family protein [Clostridium sp.]|uniref:amidase family protein n=1 Tax=Clostridium sp. TaxID=1506 RepID=UPI001ED6C083|nr:amidase family protein [Clostridium sp.]MBS5885580.1 amidase [Clostridium sp.]MDU7149276.1 amidase family protein [Clostridium sp.]